ncbi:MAG TPA: DUF4153 domain-containing protein [Longimicrobium sp.]|uniref:DUF4153 domain-containing protein n=1 Tax=Longimicrobium sp. TaxID=2029185 RepID=UPI002EDB9020
MPNPLSRTLRAYAADARAAATSAPVEVALGLLLAASLSVQVRTKGFDETEWVRLAGTVVLAFPLVFAASVLRARGVISASARWTATAAILGGCLLFGLLWFDPDRSAHGWRWFMLTDAAVLVLAMSSGVPPAERDRRRSWAFTWRAAERLVGVALYAVALYGILAGAFAAVVNLFDLKQPQHLFTDLAGAVFFGVAPWIFVGGIHRLVAPPPEGVPVAVSRLGRWLYAPVLVIYLAILYAYALKVVATGELPKNLVSPLVIAAGMIGFVGAVLLEPVHADDEHRGLSLLVRWMPALLLPLLPLAFWAVLERLGQYGWTEFRYLRVAILGVLLVLAVLGTVRLARRGAPLMSTIPVVMAGALLAAAVGPWGALAVSKRDQTARLRSAFAEAKIDPRRVPADTVTLDTALYDRLSGSAEYLLKAHGRGALLAVVPGAPDGSAWQVAAELGIVRGCGRDVAWQTSTFDWGGGIPGVAGGTLVPVTIQDGLAMQVQAAGATYRLTLMRERVAVEGPAWRAEAPLSHLRRQAMAGHENACDHRRPPRALPTALARVDLVDPRGRLRAQLLMEAVTIGDGQEQQGVMTYPVPSATSTVMAADTTPATPGTAIRYLRGHLVIPASR